MYKLRFPQDSKQVILSPLSTYKLYMTQITNYNYLQHQQKTPYAKLSRIFIQRYNISSFHKIQIKELSFQVVYNFLTKVLLKNIKQSIKHLIICKYQEIHEKVEETLQGSFCLSEIKVEAYLYEAVLSL